MQIRLLGRFRVLVGEHEVPVAAFGGRKVRTLLAVLAVHRDRYVSHDALADALWPDAPPADPVANLGVLVNRARRALGDATLISTRPRGYALAAACGVDTEDFAERVAAARRDAAGGPDRRALRGYRSALQAWAGEPLAEEADAGWARDYRAALLALRQAALEEAADLAVRLGESTLAVSYAEEAVAAAPLREVAARRLAAAHEAAGDPAAALDTLHGLRGRLRDELGVDPTAETEEAYARLLRGRRPAPARPAASGELPLLGRRPELTGLLDLLGGAGGAAVELVGAAGAGKSRLLAEVTARLDRPVVAARAYLPERAEPWSLTRSLLLAALATSPGIVAALPRHSVPAMLQVVPGLADAGEPPAGALDPASRRALLLEGAVRMLVAAAPGLAAVVVDDLQWSDPDSLVVLTDLIDRAPGLPAVLAYRPEEVPPGGAVRAALADVRALRDVRSVELLPLTATDLGALLEPAVAAAVSEGTGGQPFAVTEVLAELTRRGAVVRERHGRWRAGAPATAAEQAAALGRAGRRRRLRAQVERHAPADRTVLGLLALLARQVPVPTLAAAAATSPEDVLRSLAALSAGGLVRLGDRGWATAHDLVGQTVGDDLDAAERARLHGRIAGALGAADADPAELARHHAGAGDADAAARCYAAAARSLVDGADDGGVAELVDSGLALAPPPAVRGQLLDVRARLRTRRGDLPGARADLREALAGATDPAVRSGLRARLALLYSGAEDLDRAAGLAELAVVDAGDDPAALARALEVAAIVDMNRERADRARRRFDRALELYRSGHDAGGAARILDGRAMATFLGGDIAAAVALFGQVADLFTDSGELVRVLTPLSTAGHALVFGADPAGGLARTGAALDLARSLGHGEGTTYALWHRAEALAALDRPAEALDCAGEALEIAERLGHRGWTATALRALGIARQAAGDPAGAAEAFRRSLDTATGLSLFSSWAASRLALTSIRTGDLDAAAPLVDRALAEGPPLAHFEARLARAELAHAQGAAAARELAADAARRARAGGHLASLPRLERLAGPDRDPGRSSTGSTVPP